MSSTSSAARWRGSHPSSLLIRLVTVVVAAALLAILPASAQADPALGSSSDTDKIKPQLAQQLEQKDEASFWVRFDQADLTAASQVKDWNERGKAVYDALTSAADASQGEALGVLDEAGASYQAFYATNAIRVDAGDQALVDRLAGLDDVQSLWPTRDYARRGADQGQGRQGRQRGRVGRGQHQRRRRLERVRRHAARASSSPTSTPACSSTTRPWSASTAATTATARSTTTTTGSTPPAPAPTAPCDNNGHGTHTMGTMVGDDGGANQIGVAPGAKWIAANGCCPSDAALIASGEWMLAPTDLDGENPDTTQAPQHRQQLLGHAGAEQRPVHGGRR